ncbi:TPA: peptidoglycan-binding protein [Serratia rubidaea]|uniref:glycoside hydrolase family protein n=1 Tax=Serratia rubidaea TaxID=61652 RepID=UPI00090054E3|nr:peptidoglycan-binding protein [Serratia rubidaea]MCR1000779.1 peptidoglycan-binding protein [Serratia rubidaea]HDJ1441794.1 peptidoglycan-binding protein [Serratia rubidaea]HDJ1448456.1 peptidoglycan-binding protein [Serratia rubidaea]HDJ1463448.1 peptidoglycan-binding protein [Serratia rubidaea]
MKAIRKGDKGSHVKSLQEMLIGQGANIYADGIFGVKTEFAVKKFQLKKGLHIDGIAGRKTFSALGKPSVVRAPHPPIGGKSGRQGTRAMTTSQSGLRFIFNIESWRGVSNHLHWPGGASGVTLGPGYDMKTRSVNSIKNTMIAIGLDSTTADKISKASGLKHQDARIFSQENHDLVALTAAQETSLLKFIIPAYEKLVKSKIHVPLTQQEFDALVCFSYNPGGRFNNVASLINQNRISDAMTEIKRAITSAGKVMKGLINRRNYEVDLYLNGNYR